MSLGNIKIRLLFFFCLLETKEKNDIDDRSTSQGKRTRWKKQTSEEEEEEEEQEVRASARAGVEE